jgi:hypothetical protein
MPTKDPASSSGPLSESTYFVLASLIDGPLHGYGIIKRATEISDERVRLTAGTLYGALERLLDAITGSPAAAARPSQPKPNGCRRRRGSSRPGSLG